jgi:hypothetical protein
LSLFDAHRCEIRRRQGCLRPRFGGGRQWNGGGSAALL